MIGAGVIRAGVIGTGVIRAGVIGTGVHYNRIGKFLALQTQNLSYTHRLLEIEVKCYLFYTLPGNRYNFKDKLVNCSREPAACGVQYSTEHLV